MVELPRIKKDLKGEIKGKLEGIRGGSRNDLKDPNWRLKAKVDSKAFHKHWAQCNRGDLTVHHRRCSLPKFK